MVKVTDLACGWSLHADPATGDPKFRSGSGPSLNQWEMAQLPEARTVFRSLKRFLDVADFEWRLPAGYLKWVAADRAKLGLQTALEFLGRWSDDLLDTGVVLESV